MAQLVVTAVDNKDTTATFASSLLLIN